MDKEIVTIIGVIGTSIGIVTGVIEIIKAKISKRSIIITLAGAVIILLGLLLKPKCDNPLIDISSVEKIYGSQNKYELNGIVKCCPMNFKVSILVHRKSNTKALDNWFIHSECASVDKKAEWHVTNITVGTINSKDEDYEIFAYLVPDSICSRIAQIVGDPVYQGTLTKPANIIGVYKAINIHIN